MRIGADDPDLGQRVLDLHAEERVETFFLSFPPAVQAERRRRWRWFRIVAVLCALTSAAGAVIAHPEALFVIVCVLLSGLCLGRVLFGRLP